LQAWGRRSALCSRYAQLITLYAHLSLYPLNKFLITKIDLLLQLVPDGRAFDSLFYKFAVTLLCGGATFGE